MARPLFPTETTQTNNIMRKSKTYGELKRLIDGHEVSTLAEDQRYLKENGIRPLTSVKNLTECKRNPETNYERLKDNWDTNTSSDQYLIVVYREIQAMILIHYGIWVLSDDYYHIDSKRLIGADGKVRKAMTAHTGEYGLVTWPESQDVMGEPGAELVLPPESDTDPTALDSAYMVPLDIIEKKKDPEYRIPVRDKDIYVKLSFPESQEWENDETVPEDTVLYDYDGNVYVRKDILKTWSYIVSIEPRTRVVVRLPKGMSHQDALGDDEVRKTIFEAAKKKMLADIDNSLTMDNLDIMEDLEMPYDPDNDNIDTTLE